MGSPVVVSKTSFCFAHHFIAPMVGNDEAVAYPARLPLTMTVKIALLQSFQCDNNFAFN